MRLRLASDKGATGPLLVAGASNGKIYTYDGSTWTDRGTTPAGAQSVSNLRRSPTTGLYAAGMQNCYTSPDGITWTTANSFNLGAGSWACVGFDVNDNGNWVASFTNGGFPGPWCTSPDGKVWTKRGDVPTAGLAYRYAYGGSGPFWLAGLATGGFTKSTDEGVTWSSVGSDLGGSIGALTWAPSLSLFLAGNNDPVLATGTSSANTWTPRASGLSGSDSIRGSCWSPTVGAFLIITDIKVRRSVDGITWTDPTASANPSNTTLNSVFWAPTLGKFVLVGNFGLVRFSSDGITWTNADIAASPNVYSVAGP